MRILPAFLGLLVTACAGAIQIGPAGPDPDPTVIGEGDIPDNEIVVYRASEFGLITNVATAPAILLGERPICTCRIGQPIILKVPDGTWVISALTVNGEVSQEVTVRKGERKNLRCGVTAAPSLNPAPTLEPVGTGVALEEAGL